MLGEFYYFILKITLLFLLNIYDRVQRKHHNWRSYPYISEKL